MAKARAKTQKIGLEVRINRTGQSGASNWEGVGFVFKTRHEAETYVKDTYPSVKAYIIQGVRINVEPVKAPTGRGEQE